MKLNAEKEQRVEDNRKEIAMGMTEKVQSPLIKEKCFYTLV